MIKTIEDILAPKPEARPRIYAYSIEDKAHAGLLKVGQTTRDVKQRVAEQLKTANIKNYTIVLVESAERDDGTVFTDHEAPRRRTCATQAGLVVQLVQPGLLATSGLISIRSEESRVPSAIRRCQAESTC